MAYDPQSDWPSLVAGWRPRTVPEEAARFSRMAIARIAPCETQRAKDLLWTCAQLGAFCYSFGYPLDEELLKDAVIERFLAVGCKEFSPATTRTLRTNLRFVSKSLREIDQPMPASLPRGRAKRPYSDGEIARYLALADAQPTLARRERASGLVSLGAGAGLTGVDLRLVRGIDISERHGGVVVHVRSKKERVVPVISRFASRALSASAFCGTDFVVGGVEPSRRNVTTRLISSLSGGADLARLEIPRLRATWLCAVANRIGLATFMAAAGISSSQHLGDVVANLEPAGTDEAVALLGGLS